MWTIARRQCRAYSTLTTFNAGDYCMLRQIKTNKKFFVGPLESQGNRDIKGGIIRHDQVIGQPARSIVRSHNGSGSFMVHFPTLDEYVVHVPRNCTPIYPKDAASIVQLLDLEAGHRVLEAGTGNGSLTLYLARAVAGTGRVDTFDVREANSRTAEKHVRQYRRGQYRDLVHFHVGSVAETLKSLQPDLETYDGVILDMPDPSAELPSILDYVRNDRFIICYVPNMTQVLAIAQTTQAMPNAYLEECIEVEWKEWEVRQTRIRQHLNAEATLGHGVVDTSAAWVCRPKNFDVRGHTAFLVKLRKSAAVPSLTPATPVPTSEGEEPQA